MGSGRLLLAVVLVAAVVLGSVGTVTSAQQRALNAEDAHVTSHLERAPCLDDWGTREGAVTERASITGLAPLGVRVSVTLPYAYRVDVDGETVFADTSSDAVYAVTALGTRRVGGDEIAPC
ncbi:hypothetical protein ACFQJ5_15545 [Halomicroarcula sp. GCM10025324]|uniref:hypothetical protein n=1 Tax=Haloarcula TaxID=2237 RepID=UPI0023E82050|nr:hypothetical protein [Halomicroarcula sp. ZS-22-S1]